VAERVLVGADDSPAAGAAVSLVADEWPTAETTLLGVVDPTGAGYDAVGAPADTWFERERERARELLAEAAAPLPERASVDRVVEVGRPAPTIVEIADREDVDHVVVGSHGRAGVARLVLGSVAEAVVRRSPVPVTVVPA